MFLQAVSTHLASASSKYLIPHTILNIAMFVVTYGTLVTVFAAFIKLYFGRWPLNVLEDADIPVQWRLLSAFSFLAGLHVYFFVMIWTFPELLYLGVRRDEFWMFLLQWALLYCVILMALRWIGGPLQGRILLEDLERDFPDADGFVAEKLHVPTDDEDEI